MKKLILLLLFVPLIFSCNNKKKQIEDEQEIQEEVKNDRKIDTTYKEEKLKNKISEMEGKFDQLNNKPQELEKFAREDFSRRNDNEDIIIIKEKRTYIFPNGDKYVGEYMDDKRHGKGTFTSTKGDKYVGDFRNGFFNGQGTYTWGEGENKGDKYVGEWKNGKHNGQGTYTWGEGENKGDKYVGEFINNQKTGQGTCTYANGEKYVGEWKNGKSHGEGVYTLSDGRIIEGLFEDGQYKNILSGEYKNDRTTIDFDNGEKYIVE